MKKSETMDRQEPISMKKNPYDKAFMTISNTLARSGNNYNTNEFKLFLLTLSQAPTRDEKGWVTLTKKDTLDKIGMNTTDYQGLRKTARKTMMKSIFEFEGPTEEEWQITPMITNIKNRRNTLEIQLNEEFSPLYEGLSSHFTVLYLDYICGLNSRHAISLYMFLSSWFDKKYLEQNTWLSKADIRRVFGLSPTDYTTKEGKFHFPSFEKKVINKAMDEINNNPLCDIKIKAIGKTYKGRQVSGYNITWGPINPHSRKWNATPLNLARADQEDPFKGISDTPHQLFDDADNLEDYEQYYDEINTQLFGK